MLQRLTYFRSGLQRTGATALWLLVVLTALLMGMLWADDSQAATLELRTPDFYRDLAADVRYFEDVDKQLTPKAALQLDRDRNFKAIATRWVDFGFSRSRFWLRLPVRNTTAKTATWKLALEVPTIEYMAVYTAPIVNGQPTEPRLLMQVNETQHFAARPEPYRNIVTDITLNGGAEVEILVVYSSKLATQLPISLQSPETFYARARNEDLHNWSFFAFLIGMTLISTVYLTALGFNTAVFYGTYILATGLYLFQTDGYAFQYLWPNSPDWNNVSVAPIGMVMAACGALFARSFINAPTYHPILNRLLLGIAISATVLFIVSFQLLQYTWFKTAVLLCVGSSALIYPLTGLFGVRRGQAGSWLFFVGALAVISSVIYGVAGYMNPGEIEQDLAGHYGRYSLLFEGLAFSLAIFLHIQAMRRDHDDALQREIEVTNEKLAISEALHAAEISHERAVALAETRRAQLATTAHDIKQPLTSLRIAMLQMNADDTPTATQIAKSFDYLDDLVQANLEETTPAAHKHGVEGAEAAIALDNDIVGNPHDAVIAAPPTEETFPVAAVLNNVHAMFKNEAATKGLALRLVASSAEVKAEPLALMRIISNLVSNAIKYTDTGRILIGCRRQGDRLRIEIHDTGPGLTDDDLARVLQPYERGNAPGGTGLGLPVVADLAGQHGMTFDAVSVPGRGSAFRVSVAAGPR